MYSSKIAVILGLLTTVYTVSSQAEGFPRGCEVTGFNYNGQHLVLNEQGEQAFYMVANHSDKKIELQRIETRDVFMSPSLTTQIEAGNWAAFASDIPQQQFQCFALPSEESANVEKVDCREVLEVCQYPRAKFALSNMGNYWVSTNKPQRQVINDAAAKGIYLKW